MYKLRDWKSVRNEVSRIGSDDRVGKNIREFQ